jgi:hypothetical protein
MAVPGGPYRMAVLQQPPAAPKKHHQVNLSQDFVAYNTFQALQVPVLA